MTHETFLVACMIFYIIKKHFTLLEFALRYLSKSQPPQRENLCKILYEEIPTKNINNNMPSYLLQLRGKGSY